MCECRHDAEIAALRDEVAAIRELLTAALRGPTGSRSMVPAAPVGASHRPEQRRRNRERWYGTQARARAVFDWHLARCPRPPELPEGGGPNHERSARWYARQRAIREHLDSCLGREWRRPKDAPAVPATPTGSAGHAAGHTGRNGPTGASTGARPAPPGPPDTPRSYRPSSIPPVYGVPGVTGGTPPIPPHLPAQQHHHHEATADEIWADEGVRTMAARRGVNLAEQRSIFEAFLEEHPGPYTRRRVLGWIERQWPAPIGPADRRPRPVSVTVPPTAAPRRYETLPDGRPSNLTPEQWQLILERRRARGELVNA